MESQQLQCLALLCRIKYLWFTLWDMSQEPPKGVLSQRQEMDPGIAFFPLSFPEVLSPRSSWCFFLLSMVQNLFLMAFKVSFHLTWKKKIYFVFPIYRDGKKSIEFTEMTSNGLFFSFSLNFLISKCIVWLRWYLSYKQVLSHPKGWKL